MKEEPTLEGLELAQKAIDIANDKQASDIKLLDVRNICSFADYFVLCNGESGRQLKTIYEEIEHLLKQEGVLTIHREGDVDSGWLLLDYGDVVIHIFAPYERELYNLDELWSEGTSLVQIQ